MAQKPDTIHVSASQREEVQATHADLFVSVKGSSLISGDTALKKAKEVSQLVDELVSAGLPEDAIQLQSVYAENSTGALLHSSSATYHLRLRCEKLDMFTELLGVINSQKNSTFERMEWKYADDMIHEAALEKALQKAGEKAQKIAGALGVKLLGIYALNEGMSDREAAAPKAGLAAQPMPRSMGIVSQTAEQGMTIQHSKTVEVMVEIEYRVSGFGEK